MNAIPSMKRHYTYVIFKESNSEYYIGVRTCECDPNDDPYMGSSRVLSQRLKTETDWNKYVIQEYQTRREAVEDEPVLIDGHLGNGVCLNMTRGGHRWRELSPDVIAARNAKASQVLKGRKFSDAHRESLRKGWEKRRQKPTSEETRLRMSLAFRGRAKSEEHKRKIGDSIRATCARRTQHVLS